MANSLIAIVPSAGIGTRASSGIGTIPKQYQRLSGMPVVLHTLKTLLLEPRIKHIIVSISNKDNLAEKILKDLSEKILVKSYGRKSRISTVMNSLDHINANFNDWILVHDAVRPGLPYQYLDSLINECLNHPVGGLLALPITDTIKKGAIHVDSTVDRNGLWLAQTPQIFRYGILKKALSEALKSNDISITDEASAIEKLGYQPKLIQGTLMNTKITWPEDFRLIEKWI